MCLVAFVFRGKSQDLLSRLRLQSDTDTYGDKGFKLVPAWCADRRRTWYFRIPDGQPEREAKQKEWKQAFENACHRAELPTEMEPVSRFAFTVALEKTRYSAGLFGWLGWFVVFFVLR